jgi:hypothetical protein
MFASPHQFFGSFCSVNCEKIEFHVYPTEIFHQNWHQEVQKLDFYTNNNLEPPTNPPGIKMNGVF